MLGAAHHNQGRGAIICGLEKSLNRITVEKVIFPLHMGRVESFADMLTFGVELSFEGVSRLTR
ncbi:hypothetical protein MINTM009_53520 [Mycobacterium intracellulare]|nr:hypothetical protein L843_5458 [Mycobacterium intracellulare MIN_061107_1834]BCO81570.1 hypothetical protein MINTM009_53520 [Mycobacterium intracellulare]BCP23535.1 hypothetical protein MINTM023_53240 [Mycobacterium intracellulare]BCP45480.1 hypothetical protein MINTMi27_55730 [Mycobacterium intracellulare]